MSDDLKDYLKMKIDYSKWLISIIAILLGFSLTILGKDTDVILYFLMPSGWIALCWCMYQSFAIIKMYSFMYEVRLFPNEELSPKSKKYVDKFHKEINQASALQAWSFFIGIVSLILFFLANFIL
ncbi:hypothetical protein YSY43_15850 [Paenibacillus sp. YSY-4.3]